MDIAWALLLWAGIVVVSMLVAVVLASRWGRDPFGFALLAAVLGPIAIVALVGSRQADRARAHQFEGAAAGSEGHQQVLVPVDGSASSTRAVESIARLGLSDAEAIVLTVLPHEAQPGKQASGPLLQEHERQVTRLTSDAVRVLSVAGVPSRVVVGYGVPGEEIVEAAKSQGAGMIIIGRRGAGLTKALLGSVSDHVVKHASVPVVVID
jgi:nucleotide-binding universal stress UspA family protein